MKTSTASASASAASSFSSKFAAPAPVRRDAPVRLSTVITALMPGLVHTFEFSVIEQDVLQLVLMGRDSETIARRLGITARSARWHMHRVFTKTETESREALVHLALRLSDEGERAQA
ncbi:helix-turn-helix transcriptional regulator [Pseudenhygromyxa sp. WMMC2535]|uniref:helix-turn-helix domain-containing protein n=1 Tax=Pseudenhygromyxa sp. WMMC2535 TaxID=2712867 RepID=UPI001595C346|nr:helix-turn-helix transcriptional regulator [Pseudenhygromyxa sp. WMMC2535]NVB39038.1 helix-turn-helix transcriptional regulator [Pseudenhygromyxa sp. WMMC2535]